MKMWRPKSAGFIIGGAIIIIAASAIAFAINSFHPTTIVRVGSGAFQAQLAATEEARVKGLSQQEALPPNGALLMVFPRDDTWSIWMKDMLFAIDIVWLDSERKVIYIVKNATPDDSTDKIFTPKDDARYVLELPAGAVDAAGIKTGTSAVFTLDEAEVR